MSTAGEVLITDLAQAAPVALTDAIMVMQSGSDTAVYGTASQYWSLFQQNAQQIQSATTSNFILGPGTAMATTATKEYIMISSCAGAPTGIPTGFSAGRMPLQYDTTNNKLWVYAASGGWRGVVLT